MKKLLIALLLFCACHYVPYKQKMATWMGASKHAIIMSWGAPSYTQSDGDGGEVLTWSSERTNHYNNYFGGITSQRVSHYTDVYVNSNGNIYLLKWGNR